MSHNVLFVYADASVQPEATGLGAVIRDEQGNLIGWHNQAARATLAPARSAGVTCNEAEYAALIFALEEALALAPKEVRVFRPWGGQPAGGGADARLDPCAQRQLAAAASPGAATGRAV